MRVFVLLTKGSIVAGSSKIWAGLNSVTELAKQASVDQCFQSVSNGKTLVANAITGKGVATSPSDTFATMANNIGKISTSPIKIVTENSHINSNQTLTIKHSYGKISGSVHVFGMYSSGYNSNSDTTGVYDNRCNLYFSGNGAYSFPSLFGSENYQFTKVYYDEANLYLVNNTLYSKTNIYFAFFIY